MLPQTKTRYSRKSSIKVKAHWWIWNNWNKKSCIEQNRTKNKFHINSTGFMKIGDSSSWDSVFTDHLLATSVDRKTDINMQILNRGNNLLLRKTSICPPYWNANSKNLRVQSPTSSWRQFFIYLGFFNFWLSDILSTRLTARGPPRMSDSENQQLHEETKLLHRPA